MSEERKQRSLRDQASESLRIAALRVTERQGDLDDLKHMLFPQSHTLLEFLRKEVPGLGAAPG